jgi:pSer/pThr/pTyr-binding forkhead associated (FHA) protein
MTAPGGYARIVVLSSNFAGREFQLTKQQMVIGRTDDNDVVINHRSISRNHAKIVREPDTGRYTIMDLQSSNGVRVNGEDYGKVELRRGDTIDLGHVRFRFVEPGEDFLFGRDAQIVDVPTGKSKTWLFALLGLVVVGGVIAVVAGGGGGGKKPEQVAVKGSDDGSAGKSAGVAAGTAANPAGTGSADPGVGSGDPGTGPGTAVEPPAGSGSSDTPPTPPGPGTGAAPAVAGDATKLLGDARTAIDASKWGEASNLANQVLKLDPGNAEARTLADQAKRELANSNLYSDFAAAAGRKQYEAAVAAFEEIPADSVYKNRARDGYDKLHTQFINDTQRQANSLAKNHKCKELDKLATEAGKVFSDAGAAVRDVDCDEAVAGNPTGGNGGSNGGSSGGGSPPPSGDPTQIVSDASSAAMNGQYARALQLAEQALKMPGIPPGVANKAVNTAALSACKLKNQAKAKQYYAKASSGAKTGIRQTCLRDAKFDPGAE